MSEFFSQQMDISFYEAVAHRAKAVALKLLGELEGMPVRSAQMDYILSEARRLAQSSIPPSTANLGGSAVGEMFDLLEENLGGLAAGTFDFSQVMRARPGLWEAFMVEPPLGWYAQAAAQVLGEKGLLRGKILEIGAGVGNTSRLVAPLVADPGLYVRSDLNIKLLKETKLPGKIAFFNFDRPGCWDELDLIFGVNTLHCAREKEVTVRDLIRMLKPGGRLLVAEGSPEPSPDQPFALNYLCGFFDGWWNRGGFLSRDEWVRLFSDCGLEGIEFSPMGKGDVDLGGVIWGRKA